LDNEKGESRLDFGFGHVFDLVVHDIRTSEFNLIRGIKMLDWSDEQCDRSAAILLARMTDRPMKVLYIDWNGIPLACEYEYTPAERETRTDPGAPECFELISALTWTGFDLLEYGGEIYNDISDAAHAVFKGE
jgi:hypothetical protein